MLCFGVYRGGNRYDLRFETLAERIERDGRNGVRTLVAGYAHRLESEVRAAPFNWFNFYDFWTG